jgi:hypothetical protein
VEEIRQRLDAILSAQRGECEAFGLTDADYFFVIGLYLNPADLDAVRPALRDDPDRSVPGVGLRYRGYPVYPVVDRPVAGSGCAEYRNVWFTYFPLSHVD